jgi:hypothetical protein
MEEQVEAWAAEHDAQDTMPMPPTSAGGEVVAAVLLVAVRGGGGGGGGSAGARSWCWCRQPPDRRSAAAVPVVPVLAVPGARTHVKRCRDLQPDEAL